MNDDEAMNAMRYYWFAGFWCGAAVFSSALVMVGLLIWVIA